MNDNNNSNDDSSDLNSGDDAGKHSPSFWQVALSVMAAAFGVQSNENLERDFANGKPIVFIIGGIIFTILFVLMVVGVVSLVLP